MKPSVLVIGAGLAGLSAALYARSSGFDVCLLEAAPAPGGHCAERIRDGYHLHSSRPWLVGTAAPHPYHRVWRELGVLDPNVVIDQDLLFRMESPGAPPLDWPMDLDLLESRLGSASPDDRDVLREFLQGLRRLLGLHLSMGTTQELGRRVRHALAKSPRVLTLRRWAPHSLETLAQDVEGPMLRDALRTAFGAPELPLLSIMELLSALHRREVGHVRGGPSTLVSRLESRAVEQGVDVVPNARVVKALVQRHRAAGVQLAEGATRRADAIISAANGYGTLFKMLRGCFADERLRGLFDRLPRATIPLTIHVGLPSDGLELPATLAGIGMSLNQPLTVDGRPMRQLVVQTSQSDPTLAPPGKTLLSATLPFRLATWESLRKDGRVPRQEVDDIATRVLAKLEDRYPGVSTQAELIDAVSPDEWLRPTEEGMEPHAGWALVPQTRTLRIRRTLPGLGRFYLAGHWLIPGGGLSQAVATGREAVRLLCRDFRKKLAPPYP